MSSTSATTGPAGTSPRLVVAIGGSEGGLKPLKAFFAAMPPDCGMAFVVVLHQPLGSEANLPEVIAQQTGMPVTRLSEPTPLQPGHVYVSAGAAQFSPGPVVRPGAAPELRESLPIDSSFRSLAAELGRRAAGIVLSGGDSDGALGIAAIHGALGLTLAQEPKAARFGIMPACAIATRCVDYILEPEQMPAALQSYAAALAAMTEAPEAQPLPEELLGQILLGLHTRVGQDFSGYKPDTLRRRIERRMNLRDCADAAAYLALLQSAPDEAEALFHELLVGATTFFRDPLAIEALKDQALPALLARTPPKAQLRVWVAGCATGEEVYTLAILLREVMEERELHRDVQIFGTDLDEDAIHIARKATYPLGIAADVSEKRLERFFILDGEQYRITKEIRDMAIFATQNLVADPPFTRMDLISCRNVLRHFDSTLQQQVMPLLHYALKAGGVLFLGTTDALGPLAEGFEPIDLGRNIYGRKEPPSGLRLRGRRGPGFITGSRAHVPLLRESEALTPDSSGRIGALERELQLASESLRKTVLEYETMNEELRSANEELKSVNEELQSTNEELETAKEEQQSLNEELTLLNAELRGKLAELSEAHDDLNNLLNGTGIATLFLDTHLCIKRFTREATLLVNLIPGDIGRPLSDLVSKLEYPQLAEDARTVMSTLQPKELEVRSKDGIWYQLRVTPYRTASNVIDGVVVSFIDLTRLKEASRRQEPEQAEPV